MGCYQGKSGGGWSAIEQGAAGEERDDVDAAGLDRLAATFLAVHEDEGECDLAARAFDHIDRLEGRAAGGDYVIDYDDRVAGFEISLDLFAGAVSFWFFADGEDLEGFLRVLVGGGHADCEGNRVCAQRHAADRVDF